MSNFIIPVRLKTDPGIQKIRDSIKLGDKIKSITVKMEATHSGIVNGNNWFYTPEGMSKGARSFVHPTNAPVTLEHDPNSPVLGRVIDSKYISYNQKSLNIKDRKSKNFLSEIKDHLASVRTDRKYKGLGHIELIAKITDSDAIQRVLDGEYIGVSVGGKTNSAICSICGTDKMDEECSHKQGHFYDRQKCFLIGGDMTFDHITYTSRPADKNAASMIIKDSEDVSSSFSILDFEITTKDDSMKLNLSDVAKSNEALMAHVAELGIKDFVIEDSDSIAISDYLFGEQKTFPIATKEQAALVLDFLENKVEEGKDLEAAVTVVKDKIQELGIDAAKVIEDMQEASKEVEKAAVEAIQPGETLEAIKDSIADEVVARLQSVLTVQDSFSASRIRVLTQENKHLSAQLAEMNGRLRDSLVGQICAIANIQDDDKIKQLKQRTIASLEDKLQDMREGFKAKEDETIVEDSAKEEKILPEASVTLDDVSETQINDSEQKQEEVKEEGAEEVAKEVKVMDSQTFGKLYKDVVRKEGFAAGKALIEKMRQEGTLPAGY